MRSLGWALNQSGWCPSTKKLDINRDSRGMHTHKGNTLWGHDKKAAICKPRREASEETKSADRLLAPELWENLFLLSMPARLWYFVPVEAKAPTLWPSDSKSWLTGKDSDLWKGRRRRGQQRIRWLMASPTGWTWVCTSSGSWWWTVKPGMLQSMGLQRVGHDWATELRYCTSDTLTYLFSSNHVMIFNFSLLVFIIYCPLLQFNIPSWIFFPLLQIKHGSVISGASDIQWCGMLQYMRLQRVRPNWKMEQQVLANSHSLGIIINA